jgi:uncharacterized membrane protein YedE/YeeE
MPYWPWWAGALALGSVAVGYARFSGRPLGVSGSMASAAQPGETLAGGERVGSVVFLAAMAGGAFIAALARGTFAIHGTPGDAYAHLIAGGWRALPVMAFGGVLVGFGTRMAGGCTSGHGLSGCGRLVPASLLATATFFGVGVALSFVLGGMAR